MPTKPLFLLVTLGAVGGCAQTTQSDRADMLDRPIDCTVAGGDIAALEAAIPGAAERAAAGMRLVVPVGRIAGRVRGELDDRRVIASGRTEEDLRARIADIQAACPNDGAVTSGVEG